jgi:hypothetical protein
MLQIEKEKANRQIKTATVKGKLVDLTKFTTHYHLNFNHNNSGSNLNTSGNSGGGGGMVGSSSFDNNSSNRQRLMSNSHSNNQIDELQFGSTMYAN